MRNFSVTFFCIIISLFVAGQQDQKAKEILDQVSKTTQSYQTISAKFSFTMENKADKIKEVNNGSIVLKGKKYHVELPDLGLKIYSDGKTVWNYMENGNQVSITNIDNTSQELLDPSSLFKIYEQGYNFKYIEEKTVSGKILYFIDLFPQAVDKDFTKLTLAINKATMMIHSALMNGKDGNLYGIEVTDLKTDLPVTESEFTFDPSKYKDIEVIDFR
jgi:outer membrane lipoprotein-sorting protein